MDPKEIQELLNKIAASFEEYKTSNDAEMAAIREGKPSAALTEKVEAQAKELDALNAKLEAAEQKKAEADAAEAKNASMEDSEFFRVAANYLATGKEPEVSANHSIVVPADGGILLPEEIERSMIELSAEYSDWRKLCPVRNVKTTDIKRLVNLGGTDSGWVGEKDARPETNTSQFTEISANFGEIYANPAATQTSIDDMPISVEAFVRDELGLEFAIQENEAFCNGDGVNKPNGLWNVTTALTDDATRPFGTFQHFSTGASADLPATDVALQDLMIDVKNSLKKRFLSRARWVVSRSVATHLEKMRDNDDELVWRQNGVIGGKQSLLLGYPVTVMEEVPGVAADTNVIAFGDFGQAMTIYNRMGVRMLRDPYTNKPYVHWYTTKRMGNMITNSEAVRFIRTDA